MLAVQAFEATPDSPVWTAEDRAWATRLARETGATELPPAAAIAARAGHALQRLQPRQPALAALLAPAPALGPWVLALLGLAFGLGLAVDAVGGGQRINLLAPPVWGVLAWNLAVYLGLLVPWSRGAALPRGLRAWLSRRLAMRAWTLPAGAGAASQTGSRAASVAGSQAGSRAGSTTGSATALRACAAAWAQAAAPWALARAAVLLHAAAAALALGLVAGLYLRGLVLDYRAGWQSTFLDPAAVRAALALLLAPATAATGISVPDAAAIAALRVGPEGAATASAAPWIHLYAAMLALFVLLPRALLAAVAAAQARHRAARVALPLHEPYFQRLLHELQGRRAQVQVLPHGAAPSPQATLGLQAWLQAACGDGMQLRIDAATAYGQEDRALAPALPGTTLRVVLVDLATTPEEDSHGRFIAALQAQAADGAALLVLADEAAFRRRFGQLPARLAERRALWRALAERHRAAWLGVDLEQPDAATAAAALQAALHAAPAAAAAAAA